MVSGAAGFLLFPMVGLRGFIQQWRDSALDVTPKEGISMKDDASDSLRMKNKVGQRHYLPCQ